LVQALIQAMIRAHNGRGLPSSIAGRAFIFSRKLKRHFPGAVRAADADQSVVDERALDDAAVADPCDRGAEQPDQGLFAA
jgi:hypothetical protein